MPRLSRRDTRVTQKYRIAKDREPQHNVNFPIAPRLKPTEIAAWLSRGRQPRLRDEEHQREWRTRVESILSDFELSSLEFQEVLSLLCPGDTVECCAHSKVSSVRLHRIPKTDHA